MIRNFLNNVASNVFSRRNTRRKPLNPGVVAAECLESKKLLTASVDAGQVADVEVAKESTIDIDGDGNFTFANDGIILLAHSFGARGQQLESYRAADAPRTGAEMESAIREMGSELDIDGDGEMRFSNDGVILLAYSFGARGDQLAAHRNVRATAAGNEIESRIERAMPRRDSIARSSAPSRIANVIRSETRSPITASDISTSSQSRSTGRAASNVSRFLTNSAIANANRISRSATSTGAPNSNVRQAITNSIRNDVSTRETQSNSTNGVLSRSGLLNRETGSDSVASRWGSSARSNLATRRDSPVSSYVSSLRNTRLTSTSRTPSNSISSKIDRYRADLEAFKSSNRSSGSGSGSYGSTGRIRSERSLRTTTLHSSNPHYAAPNEEVSYEDYESFDNRSRDAYFSQF